MWRQSVVDSRMTGNPETGTDPFGNFRLADRSEVISLVDRVETPNATTSAGCSSFGIALRVAGLAHGEEHGIELLGESVAALRNSPALLERAHSLVELGSALRRSGQRARAREPLAEGLDLAARCG